MGDDLNLRIGSQEKLIAYVAHQLEFFGGVGADYDLLTKATGVALERFSVLATRVCAFREGQFDHLHSLQYASFLYLLGRDAWLRDANSPLVDRLFCLNKMMHSIELHPAVDLPGAFLLSHAIGSVLGAASYGDGLVVFQNVTVGRIGENRPIIGRNVVLFSGAVVTGRSVLGDGAVVAAGAAVHNLEVPPDSIVRWTGEGVLVEPLMRDYHALYLTTAVPEY